MTLHARAGDGGNGCVGFRREKFIPRGGPDGGDGGRGGHVILKGDLNEDSLIGIYFQPERRAEHGGPGRNRDQHGRDGRDVVVNVPCGTEIRTADTGEMIGEIIDDGQEIVVARGGKGGLGNTHWKTSTHQAPTEHTDGEPGEEITFQLELKMMADVGLVGYPNAGKSSILAAISHAHPKIAAYPFTTLNPIIGAVQYDDFLRIKVADIPGLIDGAHEGLGLGIDFLRHVERAPSLVYVVDMAGCDGREPYKDYRSLRKELKQYGKGLVSRQAIVVANKMDLPQSRKALQVFRKKTNTRPIPVSALTGAGIPALKRAIRKLAESAMNLRRKTVNR